jgi:hypothetical protein
VAASSPYKSPSSAAGAPPSPRAYLEGLKPDNLANGMLRDQTSANAGHYPTAWIGKVQASLEEPVSELIALAPTVLAAMQEEDLDRLFPAVGSEENFDWQPFRDLCAKLWPDFSRQVVSMKSLPPRTLGLLAEFHSELLRLHNFNNLGTDARNKAVSDAVFNLLIWNGIFSPLNNHFPEKYQRLVNGFCAYVKAAWGMQDLMKGGIGGSIAAMVPKGHVKQCADFRTDLMQQVARVAATRSVSFDDDTGNPAPNKLREKNIDLHFAETWLSRADDYEKVVKQGNYFLTDADGVERKCTSYRELSKFVGEGSRKSLPQVVLHVAGDRIKNFLNNTYLYDTEKSAFAAANGRRVDPVPKLETRFTVSRNDTGKITVKFSAVDHAVKSAMLVETGDESLGVEAIPLFQASLEFHGEMYFYPNEEFEAGNIRLTGQNLHLFE